MSCALIASGVFSSVDVDVRDRAVQRASVVSAVLDGVRVLEVAIFGFVPSAGAVLAEWGAEVVKVEHLVHGDPMRGVVASGLVPGEGGVNFLWEIVNRGKRSIGVDLADAAGRACVLELAAGADVFLTNFLPAARRRLGIDVDDVRGVNPSIVYARGSGVGPRGPEAELGGFDSAAFWARTGAADQARTSSGEAPAPLPGPAFGDVLSGMTLAGGIAAALLRRARTGEGAVVDVSLLGTGLWAMAPGVVAADVLGIERIPHLDDEACTNPLVRDYRTQDDRVVSLCMLEADRHWADLCVRIDRADLLVEPRFSNAERRAVNSEACIGELAATFANQPLAHWRLALAEATGVWSVVQTPAEVLDDAQVLANGYLAARSGSPAFRLVANPVQFDEEPVRTSRAPELGEHTEIVLLDHGYSWDDLASLKEAGSIT